MSSTYTLPQRLDRLQTGDLEKPEQLTQQEQTNRQTINQLNHLLMLCQSPNFCEFEDLQVYNGWFIGKQLPANYRDFLPEGYLKRFTRRRDIYDKTDTSLSKKERAHEYIKMIFKEFVSYYTKNTDELTALITFINTA